MTKNELLENRIYYPDKRDKTINLYLSLGFYVLLYDLIGKTPLFLKYDPNADMTWFKKLDLNYKKLNLDDVYRFGNHWWYQLNPIFIVHTNNINFI